MISTTYFYHDSAADKVCFGFFLENKKIVDVGRYSFCTPFNGGGTFSLVSFQIASKKKYNDDDGSFETENVRFFYFFDHN